MFHAEQYIVNEPVAEAINELMDLYITLLRKALQENKDLKEITEYIVNILSTQCKEGEDVNQLFSNILGTHDEPLIF